MERKNFNGGVESMIVENFMFVHNGNQLEQRKFELKNKF